MPKSAVGMKARSPAPPRKKACKQCTAAKARCSLDKPTCQRCQSRDLPCEFPALPNQEVLARAPSSGADVTPAGQSVGPGDHLLAPTAPVDDVFLNQQTGHTYRQEAQNPNAEFRGQHHTRTERQIDFGNIDLIPITDSASIRNRWLQSFLPDIGQRAKILLPHTVRYLSCVFRSYSRQLLRPGCFPPFIHPLQIVDGKLPLALANCFSLIRMWVGREHGSDILIAETVKMEMQRLFDEHKTYNQTDLLAAFQSYLLYATTAFFLPLSSATNPACLVDHTTVSNLQELASTLSLSGLLCAAEIAQRPSRPDWPSWIIASAKRRSLYTAYLFDNIFNALAHVPTYVADELARLPVPASKVLWEATERAVWEREYDLHLAAWQGGELRIEELWFERETGDSVARRLRVERWVEGVDEFSMMLFAVCAHIHGC